MNMDKMDTPVTRRTDPGSGYLKGVDRQDDKSPDFRGHAYYPEDFKLLEELQSKLGTAAGHAAYKLMVGRKISVYGWVKEAPNKPLGVALTARAWKEDI